MNRFYRPYAFPLKPLRLLSLTILPNSPPRISYCYHPGHHHFHQTFKKPSHTELLSVERCPQAKEKHLYTCVHCLRIRDRSSFSYGMIHTKRSITGSQRHKRFCIECITITPPPLRLFPYYRYSLGRYIHTAIYRDSPKAEKIRGVFCKICRKYILEAAHCYGCRGSNCRSNNHTFKPNISGQGKCRSCWETELLLA